jgi:tRNA(Ile2) C34 agmatinyltransferase TiaS
MKQPELVLVKNRAACGECGEILESKSVHDFRTCLCGKRSIDGGLEYTRRVYDAPFIEMPVCANQN